MNFCDSSSSGEFYSPLTLSDLDLSHLKEVRVRSESDIERELEFFEDPDYIPPPTPCSESYETKEMSSKETLSIGGSEEVRMLEYSDVSVKGESSGFERIEGGVGRNKVVEVGAKEVSVNILEVGDGSDKFYDSGADIVSEVKGYESEFKSRDSLSYLIETYEISFRVLIRPARVKERACSSPQDHWMPMYAHYLATGLRFLLPDLLVWLLLEYSVGLTQLSPNAMRVIIGFIVYCRARGLRVPTVNMFKHFFVLKARSRKEKGWYYFTPRSSNKEKRNLFSAGPSSKAKKANQNKYSLNSNEEEEVEKLVRKEGDIIDIMFLTSSDVIEAAELYGPSSMSEVEMDKFLSAAGEVAIPKKPRKKSKTLEKALRSKRKRDEVDQAQKKKRRVEDGVRGDEVVEFVPRPTPVKLDLDLRETEVPASRKGKAFVPTPLLQNSIFGNKNFSTTKNFINAYVPEVDRCKAREEALVHGGTSVVRHALETATWVNALAQEFMELVKELNSLQKERDELLKKNGEMKRELDIVVPAVTSLQEERDTLKTILSFEEKKRRMCEEENEAQQEEIRKMRESEVELKKNVQLLVHNGMEEHIGNFINSISFDNIVNLYWLPTAILAFTDCRKKVKLRWDHDEEGRAVFPPNFDFEFVAVEEEEGEAKRAEVEESQPSPPVEVHLVPFEEEQPPLPAEQEPPQPPPSME
ncbi:hypothetical protein SLEP1_g44122 [Rubroshorea leprosula]|uniref:Transposase (putative) gypsy type domain-containing protein n=1 Tax=Rubroshorea leprosula TaxID=152421 RepID=A0AAV5LF64_9ROSI|nr:hypothetical protein SLEP1_g44122 [Rubroshorea leprosula]